MRRIATIKILAMENEINSGISEEPGVAAKEAVLWGGELAIIHASGKETNGSYCLIELFATQEGAPPWHVHQNENEGFYVQEGNFTFYVGDKIYKGKAGDYFLAPKGVPHRYTVDSEGIARVLLLCSPAGFENLVRAMSTPANTLVPPQPGSIPVSYDGVEQMAAAYGVHFVEAPGAE